MFQQYRWNRRAMFSKNSTNFRTTPSLHLEQRSRRTRSLYTAVGGFLDQALCSWWIFRINTSQLVDFFRRGRYVSEPDRKPTDCECKLIKSSYGLRQSDRNWNTFVDATFLISGFSRCLNDPCIYSKADQIIGLYVDYMLIIGVREQIHRFKTEISENWKSMIWERLLWF